MMQATRYFETFQKAMTTSAELDQKQPKLEEVLMKALYTAATGMTAQQMRIENISITLPTYQR